jgi:phenylalanyl-tRNA synthetase beta chain
VATRLILDLCGGETSEVVSSGVMPHWQRSYTLRRDRVKTLTAIDVPTPDTAAILRKLGFGVDGEGPWQASVPSWRPDIVGEADLVEEVARVWGFDKIPTTSLPPLSATSRPVRTPMQRRVPQARRALAARGMNEAVTWSFMPLKQAERFGGGGADLKLLNSIAAELDTMRPSILPNLVEAAQRNEARGLADPALFEVGPIYGNATANGQRTVAAGLRHNMAVPRNWAGPARGVDVFDAKADALAVLTAIGAPVENLSAQSGAPDWYHPGRSGVLKLGDRVMAQFGELHPEIVAGADLKGPVAAFEVFLEAPPLPKARPTKARPPLKVSAFQPVERDFAFIVDWGVDAEKLVRAARNADKVLIAGARVFDLYSGKGVESGKKSIAITVTLQPVERTLTDAEIEAVSNKIVAQVAKATGAVLRG